MRTGAMPRLGNDALAWLVTAFAVFCALVLGVALAVNVVYGLTLLFVALYVPLVFADLPAAIAVWIALSPFSLLGHVQLGLTAAALLLALGALCTSTALPRARNVVRRPRWLLLFAALLVWLILSLAWSENPSRGFHELKDWGRIAVVVCVIALTVRTRRDVRLILLGLIVGPMLSVAFGLVHPTSAAALAANANATTTSVGGRLTGAIGDPNFLALTIVPAIVLAVAVRTRMTAAWRWVLLGAIVLLVVGLGATESRGGVLSALVALVVAVAITPRRRGGVALAAVSVIALCGAYLALNHAALHRVTSGEDAGNGRVELWTVAWRMTAQHPILGVGLNNFTVNSARYVDRPGSMRFVNLIAEKPHVVHNTYLSSLAETGIVGLALLLIVMVAGLSSAWKAAQRFERRGDEQLADIARAVFVATVAVLTAAIFLSVGPQPELWLLLALAVALLAMARQAPRPPNLRPPAGWR
jgi:O-antigen ligase